MRPEVWRSEICGIVRTGEKVLYSFWNVRTTGTVRGGRGIDFMKVTLKFRTVTRTKLGKDCSVVSRKREFRVINVRRDMSKNGIRSRIKD